MSDDRRVRILDGFQQPLGHLGRVLIENGMHAGDDEIHLGQHVVGEIEIAVGEYVDFDAGENGDAVDLFAGLAYARNMRNGALVVEAVGEGQVLGLVGYGHVFVAACLGGLGHFFDGVAAVGFHGVHVDVALNIFLRNQLGQRVFFGRVDLAEIFANLGRDVVEIQFGVDFFFGLARDRFLAFERGQAVFV